MVLTRKFKGDWQFRFCVIGEVVEDIIPNMDTAIEGSSIPVGVLEEIHRGQVHSLEEVGMKGSQSCGCVNAYLLSKGRSIYRGIVQNATACSEVLEDIRGTCSNNTEVIDIS